MINTKVFKKLFHVGSLNVADKWDKGFSLEGTGLSVSECPDAWRTIARLGGAPVWSAVKANNRFLNWYALSRKRQLSVFHWGQLQELVTPGTTWEVSWFDDELEDRVAFSFDNKAAADHEMDEDRMLTEVPGWHPTLALAKFAGYPAAELPLGHVRDMLAVAYAQSQGLDGVFWNERLDVLAYSAPRAVILAEKVAEWRFTKV